ncbi:hypothetical protein BKA61DRAFT_730428 [Leptodontidium sp. MPI-SDFR-AT-0119]|nr:hypothetical protein BKA61DRAFT_730428 [Leptodontidium sp. MPI-SDFR-AT-0119]
MTSVSSITRPVLGDLNANTPLSRPGAQGLKTSKSNSLMKPAPLAEILPQASLPEARKYGSADEKAPVLGAKRKSYSADVAIYGAAKRLKETAGTEEDGEPHLPVQLLGSDVLEVRELPQTSSQGAIMGHHDDPSTAPTSPASSFTSQDNSGLNDSQNTTITIPDDSPLPPRPSPLTREELRQKAREIKLRLSLASYKVRTNQIDIPISRLEIRSSSTSSRIPPLPRITTQCSQTQQISRPSTAQHIPAINLQRLSAEKTRPQPVAIPSSPPTDRETLETSERFMSPTKVANDTTREGFATPLLPIQRQGVLNPPSFGWQSELGRPRK